MTAAVGIIALLVGIYLGAWRIKTDFVDRLNAERDDLEKRVAAMRPLVEAALEQARLCDLFQTSPRETDELTFHERYEAWQRSIDVTEDAARAYSSAQGARP
jgi:hypothetical protein